MPDSKRIDFLEYLRIFAIINVFNTHIFPDSFQFSSMDSVYSGRVIHFINQISLYFFSKSTGLIVFFLVSGYIISKVAAKERGVEFLIKRIFRIYPLYIFVIILQFKLSDGQIPQWEALWPRFSLLGDFLWTDHVLNGVDWSLRIEVVFYAVMFILYLFRDFRWFESAKAPIVFVLLAGCYFIPDFPAWSKGTHGFFNIYFPLLLAGVLVAYAEEKRAHPALLVAALTVTATAIPEFSLICGAAVFFMAWFLRDRFSLGPVSRTLAGLTYSVYLFHAWYVGWLEKQFSPWFGNGAMTMSLAILGLVLTCLVAEYVIERPFIALGKSIARCVPAMKRSG